jgi:regulatory protein
VEKFQKALDYSYKLLTYRQRSIKEIRNRLIQKGYNKKIVAKVISRLKKLNLLDDLAFARLWIENRINTKPAGRKLIYQELRLKGISADVIDKAMAHLLTPEDEYKLANRFAENMLKKGKEQKKIYSHLLRRGFPYDLVLEVMQEAE